jgi:hypothetical protein
MNRFLLEDRCALSLPKGIGIAPIRIRLPFVFGITAKDFPHAVLLHEKSRTLSTWRVDSERPYRSLRCHFAFKSASASRFFKASSTPSISYRGKRTAITASHGF